MITANGPHLIQAQIEQAAGRKVLSMIEVTLDDVKRRGWRKIGVLDFGDPSVPVYAQPLSQLGLAFEQITPELQSPLNRAIVKVWEGSAAADDAQAAREAVAYLRARRVDGIILGCTELPLLLQADTNDLDLINPAQLLAEAAIRYALD